MALGDTLRAMPCCHCYHEHCIQPWMERNDWCPVCRAPLDSEKTIDGGGGGGSDLPAKLGELTVAVDDE